MEMQCQLTQSEMREAMSMNLTRSFWLRAILVNLRLLILVAVLLAAVIGGLHKEGGLHWEEILGLLLVIALVIAIYVFRITRAVSRTAAQVNAQCSRIAIDVSGISTASASGSTSFTPWAQYHRWKEGKLVFTIGDAKGYRTIPKSGLNEMQVHEVRGLLGSQVR